MANPLHLFRFNAVAEHLSFGRAATALDMDQATLSRQIRQLELDLGFPLFHRTTRHVALTPQGVALAPAARDLARAFEAASRQIGLIASENDLRLRFGMHPFVYWSPQVQAILAAFSATWKGAIVETISGTSARHIARLRGRTLDAALVLADTVPAGMETIPLMRITPHLVLPAEHPAAKSALISSRAIERLRIAIFRPGREAEDFTHVFGPFFAAGAALVQVSEGAAAVVFHATADRLAMISLRDLDHAPPDGFVRRPVDGAAPIDFVLARLACDDRGASNRFWNCAKRTTAPVTSP